MTWAHRLLAPLLLVAVAACSSADRTDAGPTSTRPGSSTGSAGIKPSTLDPESVQPPPDGLAPTGIPAGFTKVAGEGFTLAVPDGFVTERRTGNNGEPLLTAVAPASPAGSVKSLVGVSRDTEQGRAGAREQSLTLETSKRLVAGATGVRRTVVDWPGSLEAVLVEWTAQEPGPAPDGAPQAVHIVQLIVDVDAGLSLAVVARSPASTFERSRVADALRTLRPDGAPS